MTAARPAGLILHSDTEQIHFIDIIYIYTQARIRQQSVRLSVVVYIKLFVGTLQILKHGILMMEYCLVDKVYVQ